MQNIENMRRQLRSMGAMFDWSAEVVTCDARVLPLEPVDLPAVPRGRAGLPGDGARSTGARTTGRWPASRSWAPNGAAGAAAQLVEKRDLEQWFFRITKYADELLDFSGIDWPEPIRIQQTNWIGRSEGAEIVFTTAPDDHQPGGDELRVFTTRPDTLFGATFMVLAPEHPLVDDADRAEPARGRRGLRRPGAPPDRDRAAVDRSPEDRRPARRRRDQPGQRRADPDLGRRLRAGRLRHRGDHGRARPRRARLRVRHAVRAARSARSSARATRRPTPGRSRRRTSARRRPTCWSTRARSTACARSRTASGRSPSALETAGPRQGPP